MIVPDRGELTTAERAMHVAARKPLYEKLHPDTKHGGAPGKAGGGKRKSESRQNGDFRFTRDTAKKIGKSERSVQRDATRGERVKVLPQIVGTKLDKGDEIDALAKLPTDEQRKLAERASLGVDGAARR